MLMRKTAAGIYICPQRHDHGGRGVRAGCSVWFSSVVRGDVARVTFGKRCNVQDCAVVHCDSGVPNVIGDDVVIGHNADGARGGGGGRVLDRDVGRRCWGDRRSGAAVFDRRGSGGAARMRWWCRRGWW